MFLIHNLHIADPKLWRVRWLQQHGGDQITCLQILAPANNRSSLFFFRSVSASRLVPTRLLPRSKGLSPSFPLRSRKKKDLGNKVDPTPQLTSGRALIWATRFSRKNENAICRGKNKPKWLRKSFGRLNSNLCLHMNGRVSRGYYLWIVTQQWVDLFF